MAGWPRVGEVVEASTSRFLVQCHELYGAPPLGSLVRSEGGVYGVVAEVTTQSLDPGRRAVAMGPGRGVGGGRVPSASPAHAADVDGARGRRGGPSQRGRAEPLPCAHAPANPRDRPRVRRPPNCWRSPGTWNCCRRCWRSPAGSPDDVTAAFLRQVVQAHPEPERVRLDAGRKLAGHLAGQLHRLTGILRRVASG